MPLLGRLTTRITMLPWTMLFQMSEVGPDNEHIAKLWAKSVKVDDPTMSPLMRMAPLPPWWRLATQICHAKNALPSLWYCRLHQDEAVPNGISRGVCQNGDSTLPAKDDYLGSKLMLGEFYKWLGWNFFMASCFPGIPVTNCGGQRKRCWYVCWGPFPSQWNSVIDVVQGDHRGGSVHQHCCTNSGEWGLSWSFSWGA